MERFRDRRDAGRVLAHILRERGLHPDLVLGLPRGGVPVACEVAAALQAPLDVFLVRKLGVPAQPELAMGAIASGGVQILNGDVLDRLHIPAQVLETVTAQEWRELERRERDYRDARPTLNVRDQAVLVVDDGLATGSSMRAAVAALRARGAARLFVAVPVAAASVCDALSSEADEVICALKPDSFFAVGSWYQDFSPVSDAEVRALLRAAESDPPPRSVP